jgi:hypothetical protein
MLHHVRSGPETLPDFDVDSEAPEPALSFSY